MTCVCKDLDRILGRLDTIERLQSFTLSLVERIERHLTAQEKTMADIATDVQSLVQAVTDVTSDVAAVLQKLSTQPNITADQVTQIESSIQGIQSLHQQLQGVLNPTPAPTPDQPPTS